MSREKPVKPSTKVLALLNNMEIDSFVIAQLSKIRESRKTLKGIVSGKINASSYQIQNAAYVLGRLGDQGATKTLTAALDSDDQAIRVSALIALTAIGLDATARKHLREFTQRQDIEAAEVDCAHVALGAEVGPFGRVQPKHER